MKDSADIVARNLLRPRVIEGEELLIWPRVMGDQNSISRYLGPLQFPKGRDLEGEELPLWQFVSD